MAEPSTLEPGKLDVEIRPKKNLGGSQAAGQGGAAIPGRASFDIKTNTQRSVDLKPAPKVPNRFENNPAYADLAKEFDQREPKGPVARPVTSQNIPGQQAAPDGQQQPDQQAEDQPAQPEQQPATAEQSGPRPADNRNRKPLTPQTPSKGANAPKKVANQKPAAEQQPSGPQSGLKAAQVGRALKSILGRGAQGSGEVVKQGAGMWLVQALWLSFLEVYPGWLWAIPLLDIYMLIGYFKRENPFFHQLSKWQMAAIIAANILLTLVIIAFFVAVLDTVCSGLTGLGIRAVTTVTGTLQFCKALPFHF